MWQLVIAAVMSLVVVEARPFLDCRADVVFVLDRSASVGLHNWELTLSFVRSFTQLTTYGPSNMLCGVVSFGDKAILDIKLSDHRTMKDFTEALQYIKYNGEGTNTAAGLRVAREHLFNSAQGARPDAQKMLIIVTDGQPTVDTQQTLPEIASTREAGVRIFAIGIGHDVGHDILLKLVDENSDLVFTIDDSDDIGSSVHQVMGHNCQMLTSSTSTSSTSTPIGLYTRTKSSPDSTYYPATLSPTHLSSSPKILNIITQIQRSTLTVTEMMSIAWGKRSKPVGDSVGTNQEMGDSRVLLTSTTMKTPAGYNMLHEANATPPPGRNAVPATGGNAIPTSDSGGTPFLQRKPIQAQEGSVSPMPVGGGSLSPGGDITASKVRHENTSPGSHESSSPGDNITQFPASSQSPVQGISVNGGIAAQNPEDDATHAPGSKSAPSPDGSGTQSTINNQSPPHKGNATPSSGNNPSPSMGGIGTTSPGNHGKPSTADNVTRATESSGNQSPGDNATTYPISKSTSSPRGSQTENPSVTTFPSPGGNRTPSQAPSRPLSTDITAISYAGGSTTSSPGGIVTLFPLSNGTQAEPSASGSGTQSIDGTTSPSPGGKRTPSSRSNRTSSTSGTTTPSPGGKEIPSPLNNVTVSSVVSETQSSDRSRTPPQSGTITHSIGGNLNISTVGTIPSNQEGSGTSALAGGGIKSPAHKATLYPGNIGVSSTGSSKIRGNEAPAAERNATPGPGKVGTASTGSIQTQFPSTNSTSSKGGSKSTSPRANHPTSTDVNNILSTGSNSSNFPGPIGSQSSGGSGTVTPLAGGHSTPFPGENPNGTATINPDVVVDTAKLTSIDSTKLTSSVDSTKQTTHMETSVENSKNVTPSQPSLHVTSPRITTGAMPVPGENVNSALATNITTARGGNTTPAHDGNSTKAPRNASVIKTTPVNGGITIPGPQSNATRAKGGSSTSPQGGIPTQVPTGSSRPTPDGSPRTDPGGNVIPTSGGNATSALGGSSTITVGNISTADFGGSATPTTESNAIAESSSYATTDNGSSVTQYPRGYTISAPIATTTSNPGGSITPTVRATGASTPVGRNTRELGGSGASASIGGRTHFSGGSYTSSLGGNSTQALGGSSLPAQRGSGTLVLESSRTPALEGSTTPAPRDSTILPQGANTPPSAIGKPSLLPDQGATTTHESSMRPILQGNATQSDGSYHTPAPGGTTMPAPIVIGSTPTSRMPCEHTDLILLLDSSGSLKKEGTWVYIKEVATVIVTSLVLGAENTKVGIVIFSSEAFLIVQLGSITDRRQLAAVIDSVPWTSQMTNISGALRMARTRMFSTKNDRKEAPNVLLLLTDGLTNRAISTTQIEATKLKNAGVDIFVVGLGKDVDLQQLHDIASEPIHHYMMLVPEVGQLTEHTEPIFRRICVNPAPLIPAQQPTSGACPYDIVVVMHDAEGNPDSFKLMIDLIKDLTISIKLSTHRIGMIFQSSQKAIHFYPTEYVQEDDLLEYLDSLTYIGPSINLSGIFRQGLDMLNLAVDADTPALKIIMLLLPGGIDPSDIKNLEDDAKAARAIGVIVYVVYDHVPWEELIWVADQPRQLFLLPFSFPVITTDICLTHQLGTLGCDFETAPGTSTFCTMIQGMTDQFNWTLHTGGTPSHNTGPEAAVTGAYYAFIEASAPRQPGDTAELFLPHVTWSGPSCLSFFYHMRGWHVGMLQVVIKSFGSEEQIMWVLSGHQAERWLYGMVTIAINQNDQVFFRAVRGEAYSGDISLDHVRLSSIPCIASTSESKGLILA